MAISEIWGTANFKDMLLNSVLEGIYTVQARKAEKQHAAHQMLEKMMLARKYIPGETAKKFEAMGISIPKELTEDVSEKAKTGKWWEGKVQQFIKLGEEIPVEIQLIAATLGVSPEEIEVGVSSAKIAKEKRIREEKIKEEEGKKLTPGQEIQKIQLESIKEGTIPVPGTQKPPPPKTTEKPSDKTPETPKKTQQKQWEEHNKRKQYFEDAKKYNDIIAMQKAGIGISPDEQKEIDVFKQRFKQQYGWSFDEKIPKPSWARDIPRGKKNVKPVITQPKVEQPMKETKPVLPTKPVVKPVEKPVVKEEVKPITTEKDEHGAWETKYIKGKPVEVRLNKKTGKYEGR